jgi:hypothetical protein
MTHDPREALKAERAKLVADNEAATSWGAAVGARHERIKEIDRALLSLTASSPGEQRPVAHRIRVVDGSYCKVIPEGELEIWEQNWSTHLKSGHALLEPLYLSPLPAAGWDEAARDACHALNEWADLACNAIRWLKNIRSDVSTPNQALANLEAIYDRTIELSRSAEKALRREAPVPEGVADTTIRPSDWKTILAGIKKFGLAADGSDIRDLEAALESRPDAGGGVRDQIAALALSAGGDGHDSVEARQARTGALVFRDAKSLGWKDDGEGAYEFMLRRCREVALEDAAGKGSVEAIELAYGLLWVVGCDRSTRGGNALYLARKALLEQLDRAGQGRGISAARKVLKDEEAGCGDIRYGVLARFAAAKRSEGEMALAEYVTSVDPYWPREWSPAIGGAAGVEKEGVEAVADGRWHKATIGQPEAANSGVPDNTKVSNWWFAEGGKVCMSPPRDNYTTLRTILDAAFNHAAIGKGKERHARDLPFDKQPMLETTRLVGPGFPLGQAIKKAGEAAGMIERDEYDAAIAECLGAINYLAGAVAWVREQKNEKGNKTTPSRAA